MINLLHGELFKLRKMMSLKICVLVSAVCAISLIAVSSGVAAGKFTMDASTMSGLSDIFIISVIGSLIAGTLVSQDFESKTIHDAITCGRKSIVASKMISFVLAICLVVLPYGIVGLAGFISQGNFYEGFNYSTYLNLMLYGNKINMDAESIVKAVVLLISSFLLYAARLCICIPIAFKIRKSVVVTVIGVIIGFLADFFVSLLDKVPIIKEVTGFLPYSYPNINMTDSYAQIGKVTAVSIVFIVLMAGVTLLLFRKSEVK